MTVRKILKYPHDEARLRKKSAEVKFGQDNGGNYITAGTGLRPAPTADLERQNASL